jgi:hypothetical protein
LEATRIPVRRGVVLDVAEPVETLRVERIHHEWIRRDKSPKVGIVHASPHVDEPELVVVLVAGESRTDIARKFGIGFAKGVESPRFYYLSVRARDERSRSEMV